MTTTTMYKTTPDVSSPLQLDRTLNVIMADDDRNDQLLMVMAAEEAGHPIDFRFVDDGTDLMIHLSRITALSDLPDAIVLDLRMPRMDGHRTLDRLQAHSVFWQIPVIVFSTSTRHRDMSLSLDLGARAFETKPADFAGMISFVHRLAAVGAQRVTFEDRMGELNSINSQLSLLGPDLSGDIDDFFLEEIDLRDFDGE